MTTNKKDGAAKASAPTRILAKRQLRGDFSAKAIAMRLELGFTKCVHAELLRMLHAIEEAERESSNG